MRREHDVGGLEAGPIDRTEPIVQEWEKRFGTLLGLMFAPTGGIVTIDEFRRGMEDIGKEYWRLGWYERAAAGLANVLLERGTLTVEELGRKMGEVAVRARTGGRA